MPQEFLALSGVRTGHVDAGVVRNSIAFDLRGIDLGGRLVSAAVELPLHVADRCRSVRLTVPSSDITYAHGARGRAAIALNATALSDLRGAAGAFFYFDALVDGHAGESLTLAQSEDQPCVLRIERVPAISRQDALVAAAA